MFSELKLKLRESLKCHAKTGVKIWWENYVKVSVPFMGVKMPVIRTAFHRIYYPDIDVSCGVLIRREERFTKTAVGLILRDISNYDSEFDQQVIEKNIKHFSAESLKNATKHLKK